MPTRIPFCDLKGRKYGQLTIISEVAGSSPRQVTCVCDCSNPWTGSLNSLRNGNTRTCGCSHGPLKKALSHGFACKGKTPPEYGIWLGMKKRCYNKASKSYRRYGGRGITISPEWIHDFVAFFSYVGPRPSPQHSIDRYPDNNGNYEPGNVRWATGKEQGRNQRTNHVITANGQSLSVADWSDKTGINYRTILSRIVLGWDEAKAVSAGARTF